MGVTVKRAEKFKILYDLPEDINLVIAMGGRGGMKTYEVSKWVAFSATMKGKRCCILRDEKETVRESILNEVLLRYDTANQPLEEGELGQLDAYYDRLETGIKDKRTGTMRVFTKGFRASSSDKKANLKSVSDVDISVVEEAEDIRDEDKFNTFLDSIRKKGSVVVIILNTPDTNHWILKRYFNLIPLKNADGTEEDGYFVSEPKNVPGVLTIQTTYLDNPHLPDQVKLRYAAYGDPQSPTYNKHHYLTAIMGYASSGLKGQVLKNVKSISLREYLELPYKEYYGQDFGTAAPAGLVGVKVHKNRVYARELNYKPLSTLEIGKLYCTMGFNRTDIIIGDSAEPKTIDKIKRGWKLSELDIEDLQRYPMLAAGFNIISAVKGPDSVRAGISTLNEMEIYIVEESTNFWHEVTHYVYHIDKNGQSTNDPVDNYNHLIDPLRYCVAYIKKPKSLGPVSV